jgi:hypothetical protein
MGEWKFYTDVGKPSRPGWTSIYPIYEEVNMKATLEKIGPSEAQKFLAKNPINRPLRPSWINQLCWYIETGQWKTTHQGIAIDRNGNLLDGQHRLEAIIKSGKIVTMWVTRGCDAETYQVIDAGRMRTVGDRLRLIEHPQVNQTACAMLRSYLVATTSQNYKPSLPELEKTFDSMRDSFAAVAGNFRHRRVRSITRSDVGAAVASYHHKHPQEATDFMESLITGSDLKRGSPILALRNALLAQRIGFGGGAVVVAYWKTIEATQADFEDEPMTRLNMASIDWQGHKHGPQ